MTSMVQQQLQKGRTQTGVLDPRIDSPDVKVVFPSPVEALPREEMPLGKPDVVQPEPAPVPVAVQEQPKTEKPVSQPVKVDIQEAIKQHFISFMVVAVLVFGLGYLIGKK